MRVIYKWTQGFTHLLILWKYLTRQLVWGLCVWGTAGITWGNDKQRGIKGSFPGLILICSTVDDRPYLALGVGWGGVVFLKSYSLTKRTKSSRALSLSWLQHVEYAFEYIQTPMFLSILLLLRQMESMHVATYQSLWHWCFVKGW